jgi:hypothetical protein
MKYVFPIVSIVILCFVFSCSEKPGSPPDNLINKDKMTTVLVDVHLAEASTEARSVTPQLIDQIAALRYQLVFKKHGISLLQFQDSYDYYLDHPELLNEIYIEVVNRLSAMDSKYSAKPKKTLNARDSIVAPPLLPYEKK